MKRIVGPVALGLALLLAVVSLITSGLALCGLLRARQVGLTAVQDVRAALSALSNETIETSIPFSGTLPIRARVPLEQQFTIPIHTTVPFSTVVQVPIQVPVLGRYEFSVPVNTEVPLDLVVTVPVSQTVEVNTAVTVNAEVPVRLEVARLGLDDLLRRLETTLAEVERKLQWPMGSVESQP